MQNLPLSAEFVTFRKVIFRYRARSETAWFCNQAAVTRKTWKNISRVLSIRGLVVSNRLQSW